MPVKAKRLATRLRIALTGPTGSGKTYSALRLAYGMVKEMHPDFTEEQIWDKIALIDTERGRGRAYADRDDLPLPTGEYWYIGIDAPYTIEKYVIAYQDAVNTVGADGIIITDSLTHAWSGEGGVLDYKESLDRKGGNSYTNWNEAGKKQNKMLDTFLNAPCHTIFTMRSKMAYELDKNEEGKTVPTKLGLAPVQRGDLEYEFDLTIMLDKSHKVNMIIKDITFLDNQNYDEVLDEKVGANLIKWVEKGVSPTVFAEEELNNVVTEIKKLGNEHPELMTYFKTKYGEGAKLKDLTLTDAKNLLLELKELV